MANSVINTYEKIQFFTNIRRKFIFNIGQNRNIDGNPAYDTIFTV